MEEQPTPEPDATPTGLSLADLGRFLFGNRRAVFRVAGARGALLLGLMFVISAGFAREYDGEDLLSEPWHLFLPLGASLATSFVLYCLIHLAARRHSQTPPRFRDNYPRFLSLYWMTAPLAWFYAIPVEQFLSTPDSVRANLALLAIVSLWRVLLITRCAAVLIGAKARTVFFLVMLFADSLALLIVAYTPIPIFNIMGGVRLTESERVILDAALTTQFLGTITWPVWLIGSIAILCRGPLGWLAKESDYPQPAKIARPLWLLAGLSIVFWFGILPFTQPSQRLRRQVDAHLAAGQVEQALDLMSAHKRGDFPRHWNPAPQAGYQDQYPSLSRVLKVIAEKPPADWVQRVYRQKFEQKLDGWYGLQLWRLANDEELAAYVAAVESAPDSHRLVRQYTSELIRLRDQEEISETRRVLFNRLIDAIKEKPEAAADGQK